MKIRKNKMEIKEMTLRKLEEIAKMPDEDLKARVAKLCGWNSFIGTGNGIYWNRPDGNFAGGDTYNPLPNYPKNLNAMNEAEKLLNDAQYAIYQNTCRILVGNHWFSASARKRAEAFVLTLEKIK